MESIYDVQLRIWTSAVALEPKLQGLDSTKGVKLRAEKQKRPPLINHKFGQIASQLL